MPKAYRVKHEDCLAVFESNYMEQYSLLTEGLPEEAMSSTSFAIANLKLTY